LALFPPEFPEPEGQGKMRHNRYRIPVFTNRRGNRIPPGNIGFKAAVKGFLVRKPAGNDIRHIWELGYSIYIRLVQ
jgi:hypothetical protein